MFAQVECVETDFNNDGSIGSSDLLQFLSFYGNEWPIVNTGIGCGDIFFQDYTYATVVIGDQCWFSENCRYLPEVSPNSSSSIDMPVYYVYGYEGQNVEEAKSTFCLRENGRPFLLKMTIDRWCTHAMRPSIFAQPD